MVAAAANDPGAVSGVLALPGSFASLPTITRTDSYRATSAHARR